jgi:hypothetical protein
MRNIQGKKATRIPTRSAIDCPCLIITARLPA